MINPAMVKPSFILMSKNGLLASKLYKPVFLYGKETLNCRHTFKTARGALSHARSVHARWMRLYGAREEQHGQ